MKLFTVLFLALIGIVGFASAGYKELCAVKRPQVYKAINAFCPKRDMVVPSTYARNGKGAGGRAKAFIQGSPLTSCNPPQWVPYGACYSQFYRMCNDHHNVKWFGKRLCQMWRLDYNDKWLDSKGRTYWSLTNSDLFQRGEESAQVEQDADGNYGIPEDKLLAKM